MIESLYPSLDRARALVGRVALIVCVLLFGGCLALMAVDIGLRYLFRASLQHVAEIVTLCFIYVYLLGAAALYARNEDISLDFLFRQVSVPLQAAWLLVVYLVVATTMAIVLVQTIDLMIIQSAIKTPSLRLPIGIEHAALALMAVLILFTSLVDALHCWIWLRTGERPPVRIDEA